jgi:membrane protease YdiL (CAAX protease family)
VAEQTTLRPLVDDNTNTRKPATAIRLLKSVLLYYAIACGWAWLAWSPVVLGPDGMKLLHAKVSLPIFSCIATLGPFFGCFLTHRFESGNWRAVRLWPRQPLQSLWVVLGPVLVLLVMFVVFPALISKGAPSSWHWHPGVLTGLWLPMINYNLLGGPLFEEFGWRGFLQARLQKQMPPWVAAILVGIMWAAWHLPLFLVTWTSASPIVYLIIVVDLASLMAYAFNASGCAVLVAILMHSAFNASSQFVGPFLGETPVRTHPSAEFFIGFAFLLTAAVVVLSTRGQLRVQEGKAFLFHSRSSADS